MGSGPTGGVLGAPPPTILSPATDTMRQRLIDSICAMFNDYHGNAVSPDWLLELMHTSTDDVLIARLNNWRRNYPEQFQRHGIYVM